MKQVQLSCTSHEWTINSNIKIDQEILKNMYLLPVETLK